MANIGRLSNHTRAVLRPPYLPRPVSGALIARLLPVMKPSAARRQARAEKASSNGRDKSTRQAAQAAQQTAHGDRTRRDSSTLPPASPRLPAGQAGRFSPKADAGKNTYTANRLVSQTPAKNGHTTPAPAVKNGSVREELNSPSADIFGGYVPAKPDRFKREDIPPAKPAVQLPMEPHKPEAADLNPAAGQTPGPVLQPGIQPKPAPRAQKPTVHRTNALAPSLRKIFSEHPDLPAQAAILGIGDDGMPVLLDLYDPAPGALVVIGDEREQQLDILRSAVISLAERAAPRSMQIMILSCEPEQWRQWIVEQGYERFCVGIEGVDDQDALREWILRLGDWTEQRRTGQRSGPPILLVLDTLSFLPRLSYDIRLNFEWMAKEGPAAQIWPLAAISSELAQMLSSRHLLRSFHTQILGYVDRPDFYVRQASLTQAAAQEFGEPGVFAVQVGEGWLRMRVPGL